MTIASIRRNRTMKQAYSSAFFHSIIGSAFVLALSVMGGDAFAQSPIATPAIDESLFKEGAVEQRETTFDAWHLRCQEIVKMRRRFCNLLSDVTDSDGKRRGSLLLATDDLGNPAVLIAITAPVRLDRPLTVKSGYSLPQKGRPPKVRYEKSLYVMDCDTSCKFLFAADSKLISALNEGADVTVSGYVARPLEEFWLLPMQKTDTFVLTIRGKGFADALKASTEIW